MNSGLVSLYDMLLRFRVATMMTCTWDLQQASVGFIDGFASAEDCRERMRKGLDGLHHECSHAGLTSICKHIDVIRRQLQKPENPISNLTLEVGTLLGVLQRTLVDTLFYRLDDDGLGYLALVDGGLSPDGASSFPSSRRELKHAAHCLAFDQSTACVFHSMRALEFGVNALVAALRVAPSNPNWENVLNDCEKAIKAIGPASGADWKADKQFYSEAAVNFRYFKDAWRNHTMHASVSFDEADAKEIMEHSRSLLDHLSSKLREEA